MNWATTIDREKRKVVARLRACVYTHPKGCGYLLAELNYYDVVGSPNNLQVTLNIGRLSSLRGYCGAVLKRRRK